MKIKGLILFTIMLFQFNLSFAQEAQPFTYDDKGRRDPFLALVDHNGRYLSIDSSYSSEELKLTGILWDPEGNSTALINNQVLKIGQSISGFTIKEITKDSVTLVKDGKEYINRLSILNKRSYSHE